MSEGLKGALASLILLVVYLAPLVGILMAIRWWQRRGKRRALATSLKVAAAVLEAEPSEKVIPADALPSIGYRIDMSAIYGSWMIFGVAAVIAFLAAGRWWGYIGHGVYLAMLSFVYWSTFSDSDYQLERRKCESLDRRNYVRTMLLFFGALPTVGWLVVMLPLLVVQLRLAGRH